jgi:hypothetical protein
MGPRSSSVGAPTSVGSGSSPVGAADRGARPCQLYCTGDGRESPSASGGMSRFVFFLMKMSRFVDGLGHNTLGCLQVSDYS